MCTAGVNYKVNYYWSFLGFRTSYVMLGFLEHTEDAMTTDVLLIYFLFLRINMKK